MQFRDLAIGHIRNNFNADRLPILIGGTSYYMEAILWNMLVNEVDDSLDVDEPIPSSSMTDWYGKGLNLVLCFYFINLCFRFTRELSEHVK